MNAYDVATEDLSRDELKKGLRKCSNRNSLLLLIFIAFIMVFGYIIMPQVIKLMERSFSGTTVSSISKALIFIFQFAITIPIVLAIGNKNQGHKVKTYFKKPQATKGFIAKWTVITMGLSHATNYIFTIIFLIIQAITGKTLNAISLIAEDTIFDKIVMFITIAFLAPIFEELLFRGTLLTHTIKYGRWFAIIVTGCTFGLFHQNYQQIFYASVMGILACFLAIKTKSIITPMIIHFSFNLIGAIQSMFLSGIDLAILESTDTDLLTKYIFDNIPIFIGIGIMSLFSIAITVVGVILFIIEIVKNKKDLQLENPCPQLTGGEKAVIYLTAPITIIVIIYLLASTALNAYPQLYTIISDNIKAIFD
ncbi:MAG: CPBP family intramembrane metalloprotease [Clostridiales bacterium]|nr:CPBP family intramembrane metalloprotease [Clostridiales bacterium]